MLYFGCRRPIGLPRKSPFAEAAFFMPREHKTHGVTALHGLRSQAITGRARQENKGGIADEAIFLYTPGYITQTRAVTLGFVSELRSGYFAGKFGR